MQTWSDLWQSLNFEKDSLGAAMKSAWVME
jgi:hypothetical protein